MLLARGHSFLTAMPVSLGGARLLPAARKIILSGVEGVVAEKRPPLPVMLTAQRLRDGGVVYWDGAGWTHGIGDGLVAHDDAAATALEAERDAALATGELLDVFLFRVVEENGAPVPAHFREASRVIGPSFRDDFGRNPVARAHA